MFSTVASIFAAPEAFRKLYNSHIASGKSRCNAFSSSISNVLCVCIELIKNKYNYLSSNTIVTKKHYIIKYKLPNGRKYIVRVKPKLRGVILPRFEVYDANYCNITNIVLEYMGPNMNFHGTPHTPEMMGYDKIYIYYTDGRRLIDDFGKSDSIHIR